MKQLKVEFEAVQPMYVQEITKRKNTKYIISILLQCG
jgi:hypothetical protein